MYGECEIIGPLLMGRKPVGQVKMQAKIDVGDTWDWVIADYRYLFMNNYLSIPYDHTTTRSSPNCLSKKVIFLTKKAV